MKKRVAIIGGGFAGIELAKSLEAHMNVTLIEQNTHFVHTPAMVRAVVQPKILERALIPYDSLLKQGSIIHGRAQSVEANGVLLEHGEHVPADYIIVATGSANATPFKPKENSIKALLDDHADVHQQLKAARSVAIVGAGAVGTELAGEISHFMPDKQVTLVSSASTLFPDFPSRLGRNLEAKLKATGVKVILGAMAENLKSLNEPYSGTLKLSNGDQISADLIFPVIGSRARSELLEALPGVEKSSANRVKVDPWMRPSDLSNVFAVGDVADNGDPMTVIAINRQAPWLAKLLRAVSQGKKLEEQKAFAPDNKQMILIPLGPEKGNSFLSLMTVGNFLTRLIKGKDLFLSKFNRALGREAPVNN
ncbi:NADH dehydrogenase, FAD-containing subunit [Pseudovibrio denitrificans]|uniref:NADH dehydrogenase, FAD-containing subunit n=1 Tax=Pseudovibrio denitrificans TaxID=258256 RepID=A0A1I7DSD8_9HYPH|nr:FAD-dependent oxidoreductase [Pseudovibrio denitrificans]SFU14516.1 NADH dehydrogenase, FAD-containing subunit [Pseudovibrio denitrificans]